MESLMLSNNEELNMIRDLTPNRYAEPVAIKHDVFLYDEIGGAENYVDLVHSLNTASENDVFYLNIATNGGDLDGCITIINALRNTAAHTIGVADSFVASAGTIIFLACKELHIKEFAYFMFHDGGGNVAGKFNETAKQIESIRKLYRKIAEKIYKPFFSDAEIEKILDGSDVYQDADQMMDRIEAAFAQEEFDSSLDPEVDKRELLLETKDTSAFDNLFDNLDNIPTEDEVIGAQPLHDGTSTVIDENDPKWIANS